MVLLTSLFQSGDGASHTNNNTGGFLSLLLSDSDLATERTLSPEMVRRQQALEEGRQQALKVVVPSEEGLPKELAQQQDEGDKDSKKKNDTWMELLRARAKNLKELNPSERHQQNEVVVKSTPMEKSKSRRRDKKSRRSERHRPKAKDRLKHAQERTRKHGPAMILLPQDGIYQRGTWDKAPIVLEEYKLLFFTVPKVGCTAFKQLFRRMMGHANWMDHQYYTQPFLPHNPDRNGLKYLSDYPPEKANEMLTSDEWTRAIFVRDPQERVLSGYLDKAGYSQGSYLRMQCCKRLPSGSRAWEAIDCRNGIQSYTEPQKGEVVTNTPILPFEDFLSLILPKCDDPHWEPQNTRSKSLSDSFGFWATKKNGT